MLFRKYTYYLISILELLTSVRPISTVVKIFTRRNKSGIQQISLPRYGVVFSVRGAMDIWSVKETFIDRFYQRYGEKIGAGWTIIDIGGGIGDFTTFAAKAHASNRVFAFEPTPQSYQLLQENLKLNQVTNAVAFPEAVWSKNGKIEIDTTVGEPGQFTSQQSSQNSIPTGKIQVPAISLAELFERVKLTHCDLLKMDCEGAEYPILFSAPDQVFDQIERIVMEYHDNNQRANHQDIEEYLTYKGYKVRIHPNAAHNYLGYLFATRSA